MQTASDDLDRGWLPDGVTIELSPGYGKFFSNYLLLTDLARETRQLEPLADVLEQRTERLFDPYLAMMTPDWRTPAFQDNYMVEVPEFLRGALARFPGREDFRWAVTRGQEGREPKFQSVTLPYAGYLIIRSSWARDAHYLAFDAGPVGYRHAHQDKLSLVLYAFGRQILFDPGRRNGKEPYSTHLRDTFAHSTGLVDNRPQRRKWYQYPKPSAMPYLPLADFQSEITRDQVWASGDYMDHYGLPGALNNHSYPYGENSNFGEGWGKPASHFRQVLFVAPDLFVVQDHFIPNDGAVHTYEIRWHMDSVRVRTDAALRAVSEDAGQPNLGIIPLQTEGLRIETVSMGPEPELMGWKVLDTLHPATTVRHLQTGIGSRTFLTLLLPRRADEPADAVITAANDGRINVRLPGGRQYRIQPAGTPQDRLAVSDLESSRGKASNTR